MNVPFTELKFRTINKVCFNQDAEVVRACDVHIPLVLLFVNTATTVMLI